MMFDKDEFIVNLKAIDTLIGSENAADCIALYTIYCREACVHHSMTVKASDDYLRDLLGWGRTRMKKAKDDLVRHGWVERLERRRPDGTIEGWYVRVMGVQFLTWDFS